MEAPNAVSRPGEPLTWIKLIAIAARTMALVLPWVKLSRTTRIDTAPAADAPFDAGQLWSS
ncbi:hypothetical protein WKW77_13870 [Variovorax ureilyticus]|uniref:Uncharacterized protein n=1 Tax=Variovorax ureilyticus TaxID=1836198 RepID=A0ABU8VGL5_9BURK